MKTKKIIGALTSFTLVATCLVYAQEGDVRMNAQAGFGGDGQINDGGQGRPPHGGMMGRNGRGGPGGGGQGGGMGWRHDNMMGTGTPMMASGTPWKDFRGDMKNMRDDMRGKMASFTMTNLSATQTAALSAKIGLTIDQIKAALATGTPLRQLIGNKISRDDIIQIFPRPMFASTTASGTPMMYDHKEGEQPKGFFNSLRMKFFGEGDNSGGDTNANAGADVNVQARPNPVRNFFKNLFNF